MLLRLVVAIAPTALLVYAASALHWGLRSSAQNASMSLQSASWQILVWNHLDADTTRLAVIVLCVIAVGWRWREQRLDGRAS